MTTDVLVGDVRYRLRASSQPPGWTAYAEQLESGRRYGVEAAGATSEEAIDRLTRWLMWQYEHTSALSALQQAERAYHQAVASNAFPGSVEESSSAETRKDLLDALVAARERLDDVRARRPI